jgi:hypothetical protein
MSPKEVIDMKANRIDISARKLSILSIEKQELQEELEGLIINDMDAIIHASSSMKDAINYVGDKYNLPNGWMNDEFMKTDSYTPCIVQYSKYHCRLEEKERKPVKNAVHV